MSQDRVATVLAAVERCRKRLWAHCYRMTGRRAEADDLSQEAIARAIEHADDLQEGGAVEGWLFRIATTICLDHFRRERRVRALTELVDPVVFEDVREPSAGPEATALLRDEVRIALVAALQRLSPKQRAILLLHDVCELPLAEAGSAIGANPNAAKATLHRARWALERARGRSDVDVPVDATNQGRGKHRMRSAFSGWFGPAQAARLRRHFTQARTNDSSGPQVRPRG